MRTRVGYAGGTTTSPTYHSIGDHAEAIDIDFDPRVLSYAQLVDVFFASHNPCRSAFSTQYRSAAFPRTAEQRTVLEAAANRAEGVHKKDIETAIEDFTGFTLAEDYHQKYRLRRVGVAMEEFEVRFPTTETFLGSVAVTKANAFVGGYGTTAQRRDDIARLGLSEDAESAIRRASR